MKPGNGSCSVVRKPTSLQSRRGTLGTTLRPAVVLGDIASCAVWRICSTDSRLLDISSVLSLRLMHSRVRPFDEGSSGLVRHMKQIYTKNVTITLNITLSREIQLQCQRLKCWRSIEYATLRAQRGCECCIELPPIMDKRLKVYPIWAY